MKFLKGIVVLGKIKQIIKNKIFETFPLSYVFMFHHVTDCPEIKRSSLLGFEQFKDFVLAFDGCYTHLFEIATKKVKGKIAITFDDGLEDLYTLAYPFLREHNIPFTAFIVTDFLDKEGYITTEQLKEMSKDPLVTIGSHGVSHIIFPKLSTENKKNELIESQKILQEIIGKDITFFAYSHGQYDKETLSMMNCYDYAFKAGSSLWDCLKHNRYFLPRFNIGANTVDKQRDFFERVALKRS